MRQKMTQALYTQVIELIEQLSPIQQQALIIHLQGLSKQRELNKSEQKSLLRASILNKPIKHDVSNRREDWYDDDGR
jgi:chemotaxis regulatin CheY-phosphate phosphatase CheZ